MLPSPPAVLRPYRLLSRRGRALLFQTQTRSESQFTSRRRQAVSEPETDQKPTRREILRKAFHAAQKPASTLQRLWLPYLGRSREGIAYLLCLLAGLGAGTLVTLYVTAIPPAKGSVADLAALERLQTRIDEEFVVKVYRGKCLAAGKVMRGEEAQGWVELDTDGRPARDRGSVRSVEVAFEKSRRQGGEAVEERERQVVAAASAGGEKESKIFDVGHSREERIEGLRQQADALGLDLDVNDTMRNSATGTIPRYPSPQGSDLLAGALAGSRAVAAERIFWNADEFELVAVVWLGSALSGWPGVVHGGLLATVMGQKSGMAAALLRGDGNDTNADWRKLDELDVQYKKPTYAGAFYKIRCFPRRVRAEGRDEVEVETTLETLDGKICVKTDAFVGKRSAIALGM